MVTNPTVRGQGAMEYLMSYGWAVLVVLVVGVTMWQLGAFELSSGSPPTSTGFQALQPLLLTCRIGQGMHGVASAQGFTCQFVNNAGGPVAIVDANISLDGHSCNYNYVNVDPDNDPARCNFIHRFCNNRDFLCPFFTCWDCVGGGLCTAAGSGTWVPVDGGGQFTVTAYDDAMTVYCNTLASGAPHAVSIDITYEIPVGGIVARKSSIGVVHVTSD